MERIPKGDSHGGDEAWRGGTAAFTQHADPGSGGARLTELRALRGPVDQPPAFRPRAAPRPMPSRADEPTFTVVYILEPVTAAPRFEPPPERSLAQCWRCASCAGWASSSATRTAISRPIARRSPLARVRARYESSYGSPSRRSRSAIRRRRSSSAGAGSDQAWASPASAFSARSPAESSRDILVDSSSPAAALPLRRCGRLRMKVLHLVRDGSRHPPTLQPEYGSFLFSFGQG